MVSLQAVIVALALSSGGEMVLLDFNAPWCGPCRQMKPVVQQLKSAGYPVKEINIDNDRPLADKYGVSGIPCFVLLVDGQEVDRTEGVASAEHLVQMFDKARGTAPPVVQPAGLPIPKMRSEPPLATIARAESPADSQAADQGNTSKEIIARLMAASVRLRINDGQGHSVGSGTIIDSRNGEALILTCGHVFRDSQGKGAITVDMFGLGAPKGLPGRVISYDLQSDLGLVSIRPGVPVITVPLASSDHPIRKQDPVVSVGCDHGADPTPRESHVTSINKYLGPANVQVAGQPVQGRSGGGLFTADGLMIGVCNAADPADNEGLFAALPVIHAELQRIGLSKTLGLPPVHPADPSQLAGTTGMPPQMPNLTLEAGPSGSSPAAPGAAAVTLNPQEASLLADLRKKTQGAEVICIVRSLADPRAKSEIIVLDKASPAFLEQLAADQQRQVSRNLTSFNEPASTSAASSGGRWQPKWTAPRNGESGRGNRECGMGNGE